MTPFIIGILIFLHIMVPFWSLHLCKNTGLSRVKVTFLSSIPIFLLVSMYCSLIISIPIVNMGNAFGGTNDPLFNVQIWLWCVIVLGIPLFGLSYLIAMLSMKFFYDYESVEDIGGVISLSENPEIEGQTHKSIHDNCSEEVESGPESPNLSVLYHLINNNSTTTDVSEEPAEKETGNNENPEK